MLLSKRKIKTIQDLFRSPDKPILMDISNQKAEIARLSQSKNYVSLPNPKESKYKSNTEVIKKSSFPVYNTQSSTYNNFTINNYAYDSNYYYNYYPKRREIIIKNPEEIIESGLLKSKVRPEGSVSIYENLNENKAPEIQVQQNNQNEPVNICDSVQQNAEETQNTAEEPSKEIDKIIPGPVDETVKLDENPPEEVKEEAPVEEIKEGKYKIPSGNIVALPDNYSTDDEDIFTAIKTLNEDISSWKKYTDKDGIKLYFKPYPVKDEDGNDAESVIGYCEAIIDFPASKVIAKMNDFEFRRNVDANYKKGKLINERMEEGNIKIMEMYLYLKMPFIFSDRDFVVKKKMLA